MGIFSFFSKEKKEVLDKGLSKTKESVFGKIARAIAGKSEIDDEVLDNLEEVLITSDVGVDTTLKIIERVQKRAARDKFMNTNELNRLLKDEIAQLLMENNSNDCADTFNIPTTPGQPYVIMVVGVNGVGKTTTIGKLAHQYKKAGKKVYLGAADTFRAAAVEQLVEWGRRADVPVEFAVPRDAQGDTFAIRAAFRNAEGPEWTAKDSFTLMYFFRSTNSEVMMLPAESSG